MVAGPSEILVIADGKNDPDWIAADLLSQAEHDPTSQSILITDDAGFARQVEDCIDLQITQLSTARTARASWDAHGVMIVVNDLLAEAPALANRLAAEHVEIAVDDPEPYLTAIRHAGSIFLGRMTPEAVGDYVAGPNHVLPTGRRARFSSGLSVLDFMKRTSFLGLDAASFAAIGPAAATLAHAEGLPAHAKSVELRIK
jgi:histidinol dehydrogenase